MTLEILKISAGPVFTSSERYDTIGQIVTWVLLGIFISVTSLLMKIYYGKTDPITQSKKTHWFPLLLGILGTAVLLLGLHFTLGLILYFMI